MQLVTLFLVLSVAFAASAARTDGLPKKEDNSSVPSGNSASAEELVPQVVEFAVGLLNNGSRSHYLEQLETVLKEDNEHIVPWNVGTLYRLQLRTSGTNCLKNDRNCVTLKSLEKPEDGPAAMGQRNQGRFYSPFIAPLDGPLSAGKVVKIVGRAMKFAETVYVYIRSHTTPHPLYIPLCVKIEYSQEGTNVYTYHYSDGVMSEKVTQTTDKIIELGQEFTVEIKFQKEHYDISINGKSFTYPSKIPYIGATHVEVSALATVINVEGIAPVTQRGLVSAPPTPLILPIHDLPLGRIQGRIIGIGGDILPAADNFEIRLQSTDGLNNYTAVLISLKFNFNEGGLMVNHYANGVWAEGQWHPGTQWFLPGREKGQPFYVEFHLNENKLLCVFHGDWSFEYPYNVPLQSANHLVITGDLQLNRITGLSTVQDCSTRVLHLVGKMWNGGMECVDNYDLSFARFGNIPVEK